MTSVTRSACPSFTLMRVHAMLLVATLSGIQDYLFDIQESGGGQARSLRHRSFLIQLDAEIIAQRLLAAAGLPRESLLFCAASKLCIAAPGATRVDLDRVQDEITEIERHLLEQTHGRLRLAVAIEASDGGFRHRFEQAHQALNRRKLSPWRPGRSQGEAKWTEVPLILRQVWDRPSEARRDAEIGRQLTTARWLAIERGGDGEGASGLTVLGHGVRFSAEEPRPGDALLSCSNLARPEQPPATLDRRLFHPRRLARHVPRDPDGGPTEFLELAARSRGAAMLGVLKADADGLGAAISAALQAQDDHVILRSLSEALDRFFAETLEQEKARPDSPWRDIYTVFSGGDDLLAVGPWNLILDFAAHVREAFHQRFGPGASSSPSPIPLTISAGVALIKPRYPVHFAAAQADEELDRAKSEPAPRSDHPKDQCAALGMVWKWRDHDRIIQAGRQLADWVDAGVLQRGWLHTLLELALLRRGEGTSRHGRVSPALATSRLAYHVGRNWPRLADTNPPAADARRWIDQILGEFDLFETTTHPETLYLPAIVRYAILATRSSPKEDTP